MMKEERAIDQTTFSYCSNCNVGAYVDSLQASGHYIIESEFNDLGTVAADTVLPIAGGSTVGWDSENNETATDGGADFAKVTLTPKRISWCMQTFQMLYLAQNGPAAEACCNERHGS